jgi:hypothetical protein
MNKKASLVILLVCLVELCSAQSVAIGSAKFTPVNMLDVSGAMVIGTYAGVNTAPANGLLVSGNVGIGTSAAAYALTIANGSSNHIGFINSAGFYGGGIYGDGSQLILNFPYPSAADAVSAGDNFIYLKFPGAGQDKIIMGCTPTSGYISCGRNINFCVGGSAQTTSSNPILTLASNNSRALGIGVVPVSTLDILGTNGYSQLRLQTSYTPSGSADGNGNTGDISWDTNFLYIKTGTGWVRSALTAF